MKEWISLFLAILTEICGTTAMKFSDGFTHLVASLLVFVFYGVSFYFFSLAIRRLPLGTSYAIWSALGTAAIAVIGFFYFGESFSVLKIISLLLIIFGVVGLRLSGV